MSRPLVLIACAAFAVVGLAPLVAMVCAVGLEDLQAVFDERSLTLFARTAVFGLVTAGCAIALGVPFGFLVARTDVPGAGAARILGVVPICMPPVMLAMSWTVLWQGLRGAPASVFVMTLSTFPLVAAFTARAFERIDGRLEDAARLIGGRRAILRADLPLALPAILVGASLAFLFTVNEFGVPDYVGFVGPKFNVYAAEAFFRWKVNQEPGVPIASAVPLALLASTALIPALALRRRGSLASLSSDFRAPSRIQLGRWRWPAFVFVFGVVGLACLLPIGRFAWEAARFPQLLRDGAGFEVFPEAASSLKNAFSEAIQRARGDLASSLLYATAAALIATGLALILGHALERMRRRRLARFAELVVLLPLAAPTIAFSIGLIALWNHAATAQVYDGGAVVIFAYVGRFAPLAILAFSGAVASLDPRLEEAAQLGGVPPAARLGGVVGPSLFGTLGAAFVLVFVFAMRELDTAILLPAANQTAMFRVFNAVHFGRDSFVAALSLLLLFSILLPGTLWTLFARRRLEVLP